MGDNDYRQRVFAAAKQIAAGFAANPAYGSGSKEMYIEDLVSDSIMVAEKLVQGVQNLKQGENSE